jgi:holo-[acyl-carrier protein] synthase
MSVAVRRRIAGKIRKQLPQEVRVGADLVEIESFRSRFEGRDALLQEVFTEAELAYARARRRPWLHLAARFAAKEATFKAIGCGVAGSIRWRDVEVCRDEAGEPSLALSGETARRASSHGLRQFAVSLSHGRQYAVAVVLGFGRDALPVH